MSTSKSHRQTSLHLHYRIRYSNLEHWKSSPIASWQRICILLLRLGEHDRQDPNHVFSGIFLQHHYQMWKKHLYHFLPILVCLLLDHSTTNHTTSHYLEHHYKKLIILKRGITYVGRITFLICSILWSSGDKPPCIQKIFSSIIAATGMQLKQSVKLFHNLMEYLLLHSS